MVDVLYMISHGHTARGVFQTRLLERLLEAGLSVAVVTKRDPEGMVARACAELSIPVHFYEPPHGRAYEQRGVLRNYVHQDVRRNPALYEKHLRRTRRGTASLPRRLANHAYLALGAVVRALPPLQRLFRRLEDRMYHDPAARDLLRRVRPRLIVSTRPVDSMEAVLLNAARHEGIRRALYILSWDNITAKGAFPETGDYYLTWGPIMDEEVASYYGVPAERILPTGVTHFDVHCAVRQAPAPGPYLSALGLRPDRPYLLFTMSAGYYAPDEIRVVEWLAKRVESGAFGAGLQLVVRPHMHNVQGYLADMSWLRRLEALRSGRVAIDVPDTRNSLLTWYMDSQDMHRLSHLIAGAAVCLNSGSTIAVEAAIVDTPVILTFIDLEARPWWESTARIPQFIHLRKFIALGAAAVADSLDALEAAIHRYLADPALHAAERRLAAERECLSTDGRATERFVAHIAHILRKEA